jgi:hypothetical protein
MNSRSEIDSDSYDVDEDDVDEGTTMPKIQSTLVIDPNIHKAGKSPINSPDEFSSDSDQHSLQTFVQTNTPAKETEKISHYRTPDSNQKIKKPHKPNNMTAKKPQESAKFHSSQVPTKIPVVTKLTTRDETYDLEYLMNPSVQKLAKPGNRFSSSVISSDLSSPKKQTKDFLKKNKGMLRKGKIELNSNKEQISEKKANPKASIDQRFDKYAKEAAEKVHRLSSEVEARRQSECSFKPNISKSSKQRPRRNATDFYKAMKEFKSQRDEKVHKMAVEKEQLDLQASRDILTFKPSISNYSEKLKREGSIYERLYYMPHKATAEKNVPEDIEEKESLQITAIQQSASETARPFVPTVNKVSQEIVRDKSIVDHLYQDAIRRMKKPEPVVITTSPKLISDKSEQVLIEKLEAEFIEICKEIDPKDEKLNYSQQSELLQRMYFIKNDVSDKRHKEERDLILNVWKFLKGEEQQYILQPNLLIFLNAVMNYYSPSMSLGEIPDEDKEQLVYNKCGVWYKDRLYLKPDEIFPLHKKYELLYHNRVSVKHKSNQNRSYKEEVTFSFRPEISKISKALAFRSKSSENYTSIEDYLLEQKKLMQERKDQLKKEVESKQQAECPFAPKVLGPSKRRKNKKLENVKETLAKEYMEMIQDPEISAADKNEILFRLGKISRERKEKMIFEAEKRREIEEVKGCTFIPNLEQSRQIVEQEKSFIKGVDATLERIKKAREMKEWLDFAKQKGFTNSSLVAKLKQDSQKESFNMIHYRSASNSSALQSPNSTVLKSPDSHKNLVVPSINSSVTSSISYTPFKSSRSSHLSGSENEEIEETIVVDVSLRNGIIRQLHINPDDNLEICARKFILDNNIPAPDGEKLIKQLKEAFS